MFVEENKMNARNTMPEFGRSPLSAPSQLTLLSLFSLQILDDSNNIRVSDGQMRGLELLLEFSKRALGTYIP